MSFLYGFYGLGLAQEETSSMADGLLPYLNQMDPPSLTPGT